MSACVGAYPIVIIFPDDCDATMPARILFVSPGFDVRGGAERSLQGLIENLDRDEFAPELLVFGDGSLRRWAEEHSVPTHLLDVELPRGGKRRGPIGAVRWGISALPSLLRRRPRLRRLLVERDIDLVHTNGLQASVVAGSTSAATSPTTCRRRPAVGLKR